MTSGIHFSQGKLAIDTWLTHEDWYWYYSGIGTPSISMFPCCYSPPLLSASLFDSLSFPSLAWYTYIYLILNIHHTLSIIPPYLIERVLGEGDQLPVIRFETLERRERNTSIGKVILLVSVVSLFHHNTHTLTWHHVSQFSICRFSRQRRIGICTNSISFPHGHHRRLFHGIDPMGKGHSL